LLDGVFLFAALIGIDGLEAILFTSILPDESPAPADSPTLIQTATRAVPSVLLPG
jgi:hypothetical protein